MQRGTKTLSGCLTALVCGSQIARDQFVIFAATLLILVSNGRNSPGAGGNAVFCTGVIAGSPSASLRHSVPAPS